MRFLSLSLALLVTGTAANAATIAPGYASDYTILHDFVNGTDFATSPGTTIPNNLGGITFLDANTILVGGAANGGAGAIYQMSVTRDINSHISGFGAASLFSTAP